MTQTVLTGPVRTFGADPYTDWVVIVKQLGGTVASWPFNTGLYASLFGRPAARFTRDGYIAASRSSLLNFNVPTQPNAAQTYFYVLAPAEVAASPQAHTMTTTERIQNTVFAKGDQAADALGLPSLQGIEDFIKSLGKDAAIIGGVIVLAWYLLNRRRG